MFVKMPERVSKQRQEVVDRIIADMEQGGFSWTKPWQNVASPHNPVSGTFYSGGNRLHLAAIAAARGYDDPRWVTFRQAKDAGWKMRKGAESAIVEKWKMFAVRDGDMPESTDGEDSPARLIPRCVGYWSVFNACEFDGVPPLAKAEKNTDEEISLLADEVMKSSRCPVNECNTDTACYYPMADRIEVPYRDCFSSNEAFLSVLLHEMGHSTGHLSALGRNMSGTFGNADYAREELIAELASLFCASDLGLDAHADSDSEHYQRHVAYLASWKQALKEDPAVLFRAASKAEAASGYIIRRYEEATGKEIRPKAQEREELAAARELPEAGDRESLPEEKQRGFAEIAGNVDRMHDAVNEGSCKPFKEVSEQER